MSVSIKDIAKKLNVSVSTVSRALNGNYGVHKKTRERILEAAEEMGYVPNLGAKELVNKKSNLIGIIIPEVDFEVRPPFFETFPYINRTLKLYGRDTIIASMPFSGYRKKDLEKVYKNRNLEGFVIMPGFLQDHPMLQDALDLKVPVVAMEEEILGRSCSNIGTDEVAGAYDAVRYLLDCGHRKIGFINGPFGKAVICGERFIGYQQALESDLIDIDERLIINSDFTGAGGAKSVLKLIERDSSITAIFFANDLMAMGAITALQQKGIRVPEEISVVGFDGMFVGEYFNPPLTTVKMDNMRIGIRAAELLMEMINGGSGKSERIQADLVVRSSAKAI